ncbi:MAG: tetratricopeptide repeat protein [Burkholderiales bacterium]|nr:tetratricopeptide repeat protein [Burkholderiales bacterium]
MIFWWTCQATPQVTGLPVFARKPAPVQVTWLGYFGSTGLTAMDYRLTDAYMDPPGFADSIHTEKLMRLPFFSPFQPADCSPAVNELPALQSGRLTLASMNSLGQAEPGGGGALGAYLEGLTGSRMMLCNLGDGDTRALVLEMFAREGIEADRLVIQPWLPMAQYLALHNQIDLALDPFPYNGGTITNHSLWMGVPVVTLAGDRPVGRIGVALMMRAGLPEFITQTEDEYLACVLQQAQDLPRLNQIRLTLRERISANLGASAAQMTVDIEAAYRRMWVDWCGAMPAVTEPDAQEMSRLTLLFNQGHYAQGAAMAQALTVRCPLHGFGWKIWGAFLKAQNQADSALLAMQRAVELQPTDAEALRNLAITQRELGLHDMAATSFGQLAELLPGYAQAAISQAKIYEQLGRWQQSEQAFRRALLLLPGAAELLISLGFVLMKQGKLAEAQSCYEQVVATAPDHVQALYNLGVVLTDQGQLGAAERCFRKAIALKPDDARVYNNLAGC